MPILLAFLLHSASALSACIPPFEVGSRTVSYIDSTRAGRVVSALLSYPAAAPGGPAKERRIQEILGASHCQFASNSLTCNLGEQSCGGAATITLQAQQSQTLQIALDFLNARPWPADTLFFDDFE